MNIPDGVMLLEPREVYDKALVGFTTKPRDSWPRVSDKLVAVYSTSKCIKQSMKAWDWTYEDALEWFEYNTSGAWAGEGTPTFKR